ncbi:glycoside hydrolase family 68 protein [Clostridium vincentii]|uniref:Levansucrase n=1 Tax=Clostridium vincentii TaxID=52704 RepID=A0A2T0BAU5_9CLOT|nr:glycoside hydrolase family 68 protein [Clostridium vincentii]PRR80965.1 Levansucrase precursor [Clostridium vincentii]
MINSKIGKFVLSASLTGALLVGSETVTFAKNVSADYNETYDISHMTRSDMLKIPEQQKNPEFKVPQFDMSTIKNIDSAKGTDTAGNPVDLDVWDSWPLQNADGTVANYNGYNINFALAGDPEKGGDTFVHMFYQKIGDTSVDSWKSTGRVFKPTDKDVPNDALLKNQSEEWSGSATLTSDGQVRLFYTNREAWTLDTGHYGKQTLTTAQINISEPDANTLKIDGVEDYKSIFDGGDGTIYQNVQQGIATQNDNHTLRDPHYVEDNGRKYLVFEANTGTEVGYQGDESLYNKAYYGKSENLFQTEKNKLLESPKKELASLANGALGIIELNDDYSLKKVMKPLITANTITDEIERPNIFKMNDKWYLFTDSRGAKMTIDGLGDEDVYMLGFVADSLTGEYKPLNKTGLVINMDQDPMDPTFTYSHFAIPQADSNNVVITSYMTNRGAFEDQKSTFAPSYLMNIKGSKTSIVPDSILEQGQLTNNK